MSSLNKVCGCGAPIALHNSNRGITECHECQAKSAHTNALAKEFIEQLFEAEGVDDWQAKLKASPEVRAWAMKQFNDVLVKKSEENDDEVR